MTTAYALPRLSRRFVPVWRRNFLVWRKLAAPSVLFNLADPTIYMLGLGYGLGALMPEIGGPGLRRPLGGVGGAGALMDLTTHIGPLRLANPFMAASGCFGYGVEYRDALDLSTIGAIVVKGLFQ